MPVDDPIDDFNVARIDWFAREVFGLAYDGEPFLSARIEPIYGRRLYELNQGQARMVVDDLRHAAGDPGARSIDWPTIVGEGESMIK